ncbi:MAG: serine hydrolase domain-containing protein [Hyphomonas sp.]
MAGLSLAVLIAACTSTASTDAAAQAQPLSFAVEPEAPAFHETGVRALEDRMAAYVTDGQVKGIATRLVKDGEIVSDIQAGIRREADQAPITEDTIYRIYSMSKPVTGVALLMLWEEGKFQLDDPVTRYIPELEGLQVFKGLDETGQPILAPVSRPPTMQELMSHTAGFGYGLRGGDYVNDRFRELQVFASPDMDTFIDRVASIPLLHEPGTIWDYSISVDIQGYLVEKFSGQTLGDFFKTRIFDPLGMKDTGFFVPEDQYERFADVYVRTPDGTGFVPAEAPSFRYTRDTIAFEGGGHGLVSTMDDYARFAEMLVNEGTLDGAQILKPETVRMMAQDHLPEGVYVGYDGTAADSATGVGFGLNVAVILEPASDRAYPKGAYMWGGAAGTWFWVDPENDLYFIGMVQHFGGAGPGFDARAASARLVYEALEDTE